MLAVLRLPGVVPSRRRVETEDHKSSEAVPKEALSRRLAESTQGGTGLSEAGKATLAALVGSAQPVCVDCRRRHTAAVTTVVSAYSRIAYIRSHLLLTTT